MTRQLILAIEPAEIQHRRIEQLCEAIIALSTNETAADVLTTELKAAVLNHEKEWEKIEQRDDFKAKYSDRENAHEDFIRNY